MPLRREGQRSLGHKACVIKEGRGAGKATYKETQQHNTLLFLGLSLGWCQRSPWESLVESSLHAGLDVTVYVKVQVLYLRSWNRSVIYLYAVSRVPAEALTP